MNARAAALQGALAVLGLVASYFVWQREPEETPGEVTVLEASRRALQRVSYEDGARFVELYRDARDEETFWVRLGEKTHASSEPAPLRELRGNALARRLFERFAPLKGRRALGALDTSKLEELGLTHSPRKLTVRVAGQQRVLTVAPPAGEAWGSPYARREDGLVFLLSPTLLPDLESAESRLVDRRLHAFELGDFDALTVSHDGRARTYIVNGSPPSSLSFAPQEAPGMPEARAHDWHERLWQLQPLELLSRGEALPGGMPEEVFRVEYRREGEVVGHLTVTRADTGDFHARTEHTAGWVQLPSGVDALAAEALQLVSGR